MSQALTREEFTKEEIEELTEKLYNFTELFCFTEPGTGFYPYQEPVVRAIIRDAVANLGSVLTAIFARQSGKLLDCETPILTTRGWKTIGTVNVGDFAYAEDGTPSKIEWISNTVDDGTCYELQFSHDIERIVADANHLWKVKNNYQRNRTQVLTTQQMVDEGINVSNSRGYREAKFRLRCDAVVEGIPKDLPIDPYVLGYWLGDGSSNDQVITVGAVDEAHVLTELNKANYKILDIYRYNPTAPQIRLNVIKELRSLGVLNNKHIPDLYLEASVEQRKALLAGLLDSDGSIYSHKNPTPRVEFGSKFKHLTDQVIQLARSLGQRVSTLEIMSRLNGKECGLSYRAYWTPTFNPFRMKRKADIWKRPITDRQEWLQITDIRNVPSRPCKCIRIAHPSHVFLVGKSFIPTHNSEAVADVAAALMVILPKLAHLKNEDGTRVFPHLFKFRNGLYVGVFAPSNTQAGTTYKRVRDRLTSSHARVFLQSPEFALTGHTSLWPPISNTGTYFELNNGSLCLQMTAEKTAKIESKTYHLILYDESQDLDSFIVGKSIAPMGAATNASSVATGTPGTTKGFFYSQIKDNQIDEMSLKRPGRMLQKKLHFEADYRVVQKYNPDYKKHIAKEKRRLGEESDEFQMAYCVSPETKILTANLHHVEAKYIKSGDELVGFDEIRPSKGCHRRIKKSVVEDVDTIIRPCYKLEFSDGTKLTCSEEHQWLVINGGRTLWRKTKDLSSVDTFFKICDTWNSEHTYGAGYLAAAFDGEGHFNGQELTFTQRDNAMLEEVKYWLNYYGFNYHHYEVQGTSYQGINNLKVAGGRVERMRFLGQIRPKRLLAKLDLEMLGTIGRHDRTNHIRPRLVSKTYAGDQRVIAIRTSTRTYVAEGFASHNCLKWLLERGMAVSEDLFEELSMRNKKIQSSNKVNELVAGLDWGKGQDSTVLTIGKPYWEQMDENGRMPVEVIYWWHKVGDNYENIIAELKEQLSQFSVSTLAADATGVGEPLADRLIRDLPLTTIVPVKFTAQSKDFMYKNFLLMLQERQCRWPADPYTRERVYFKRFKYEMLNLVKEYKNGYLACHAPDDQSKAHDDFPDSLALMLWCLNEECMPFIEVDEANFYDKQNWHKPTRALSLTRR